LKEDKCGEHKQKDSSTSIEKCDLVYGMCRVSRGTLISQKNKDACVVQI